MHVSVYRLGDNGYDIKVGTIRWVKSKVICEPSSEVVLQRVASRVASEQDLQMLPERYRSAYLRCTLENESLIETFPE